MFGEAYPFILGTNELARRSRLNKRSRLYISLLLSSNLGYAASYKSELTSSFELLCLEVMRAYLPKSAQVHLFGSNPLNEGIFSGHIFDKISRLNEMIGWGSPKVSRTDFSPHDTGDKGLDIVAWLPLGNSRLGCLLLFGQCACGEGKWVNKQDDSSAKSWSKRIEFVAPPSNVLFIPFCLRTAENAWPQHHDIRDSIVMDRVRIMDLLRGREQRIKDLPSLDVVKTALEEKEKSLV